MVEQRAEVYNPAEDAKSYIEMHYMEDIYRETVAANVYLSPQYLSKIFKQQIGCSLTEYINFCRIREAKRLMTTTDVSVSWIAIEVGFESCQYFSTVFKKISGTSPRKWRQCHCA